MTLAADVRRARCLSVRAAIAEARGNRSEAARALGVHRNTVERICKEEQIEERLPRGGARKGWSWMQRKRLGEVRVGTTHKFVIDGQRGYVTVNCYEDGAPGEMFLKLDKVGSAVHGWTDAFSIAFSMLLQQGTPLAQLVGKFRATRFEPAGVTGSPEIGLCTSALDYVMRWMELRYLKEKP